MSVENTPRLINSGKPFRNMAIKYHEAGWYPLPLPPRKKEMPPTGYTGHNKNKYMSVDKAEQITTWLENHPKDANIGMWLHDGVVGLDVDAYFKGEKQYEGQLTFAEMEKKLGALPPTWTSTARSDKVSGIRFFQVPKGLVFPGKAGPGIDIIYSGYRYTVVYPSSHPEGGQYQWYRPGMDLDGAPARWTREAVEHPDSEWKHTFARIEAFGEYPHPDDLTYLPEAWVQELQLGKKSDKPMDVDSTIPELYKWVDNNFQNATLARGEWCSMLKKTVKKHVDAVKDNADTHQYIINAHWSLMNLGVEGHKGWGTAIKLFDRFLERHLGEKGRRKRLPEELNREINRSKWNAMRLIKGKIELAAEEQGISLISPSCRCFKESEVGVESSKPAPKPTGAAADPFDYRLNDDGNAEHLIDLYKENLMYITGFEKWMLWNGTRWERDADGVARRCFWKVRDRQESAVDQLWSYARNLDPEDPEARGARKRAVDAEKFAQQSGNNTRANAALEAATSIQGVSINPAELDVNPRLLGVENGLLELTDEGVEFRKAKHDDFVTLNTGVKFFEPTDLVKAGGDVQKGLLLWKDYLDRFIPDLELRRFVQKVMGYCMLGSNAERLAIFLYGDTSTGKSVMLKAVMGAMGEYAATVNLNSVFKDRDLNPALAAVLPKRIITASEAGSNNHLHADLFKRITGNDHISAELKFSNEIQVRIPAFTPVIATNGAPTIEGADTALKKRLLVIPFNHRISADDDRKTASDDIAVISREAVFAWLVEGWKVYAKEGLDPRDWPEAVKNDTLDFSASLSDMGEFVADMLEPAKGEKISGADAFDAYIRWAAEQRIKDTDQYPRRKFAIKMKEAGFPPKVVKIDGNAVRGYDNLKLNETKFKFKSTSNG